MNTVKLAEKIHTNTGTPVDVLEATVHEMGYFEPRMIHYYSSDIVDKLMAKAYAYCPPDDYQHLQVEIKTIMTGE
tara:strand:+ start:235 stop:459 length:225 start_codon:yes stop_codon:yes gene_type:complete